MSVCEDNVMWFFKKKDMQEAAAKSGYPVFVARDFGKKGAKGFAALPSHENLFKLVMESSEPCFYELLREGAQCKLYFDIEWRIEDGQSSRLNISAISTVIFEVLRNKIPLAFEGEQEPEVIQLEGTRTETKETSDGGQTRTIKNSFHLVFPTIVFAQNTGSMKEIAEEVESRVKNHFELSKDEKNPIDVSVYSKDQNFRAPLCYKRSDTSKTRLLCDDLAPLAGDSFLEHSEQLRLQQKYLRALVTHIGANDKYTFFSSDGNQHVQEQRKRKCSRDPAARGRRSITFRSVNVVHLGKELQKLIGMAGGMGRVEFEEEESNNTLRFRIHHGQLGRAEPCLAHGCGTEVTHDNDNQFIKVKSDGEVCVVCPHEGRCKNKICRLGTVEYQVCLRQC